MKIYVGNMSYNVNSEELRTMFAEFGGVESAEVIIDRSTNRSKGFGFVEMSDDEEAKAAINGLNGKEMDGRTLNVSEARPRAEGSRGGGGGGGGGSRGGYGGPPKGGGGGYGNSRRF
jgi:cold-inducible RNA-binding protein